MKNTHTVGVQVDRAASSRAAGGHCDLNRDVEAVDERNVIPVRVAVAAERPLRDGRGRDTRAGVLRALEAAVAAAVGALGRGVRVAEVAVAAGLHNHRQTRRRAPLPIRVPRYGRPSSCRARRS